MKGWEVYNGEEHYVEREILDKREREGEARVRKGDKKGEVAQRAKEGWVGKGRRRRK